MHIVREDVHINQFCRYLCVLDLPPFSESVDLLCISCSYPGLKSPLYTCDYVCISSETDTSGFAHRDFNHYPSRSVAGLRRLVCDCNERDRD